MPLPSDPIRVIVVEDEPRLRELLADVIPRMGFATITVRSAEEAMRSLDADPRDVAILDLNLPGMDGMDLFQRLHDRHPQITVIILTGFGDLDAARRAIRLDVVDFLTKPCRLDQLEQALDRARRRVMQARIEASSPLPAQTALDETDPDDPPRTLEQIEYEHILAALRRNHGNRTAAAAELGISRRTLHYRLADYQVQRRPTE